MSLWAGTLVMVGGLIVDVAAAEGRDPRPAVGVGLIGFRADVHRGDWRGLSDACRAQSRSIAGLSWVSAVMVGLSWEEEDPLTRSVRFEHIRVEEDADEASLPTVVAERSQV